jgi:beta-lactamase regulating signal transducer with metallopeptidase domain/uncharacterized GH25 family protein
MNTLLQSLASEEWVYLVKALLHTLWLGGLAAGGLCFVLRRKIDPVTRYQWCVGALFAVVLGGIVAWAILPQRPTADHPSSAMTPTAVAAPAGGAVASPLMDSAAVTRDPMALALPRRWTPWLALVWLGGTAAMLARTGSLVAGAEKLRRRSSPLENEAVLKLIGEARRKLGLARRIQVVVTERLTSPAVMGLVAPVLILPLSMVTTLPMEQLQLILLHELAHIRRGDYLVNLCQLLVESLLFFNPAVWWISRQIRQEREACCDAVTIALAGERLKYARTLAQVAGDALTGAPAFGNRRNPSGLKDRIQRLLVPGYCPALQLTWRALLAALFAGGAVLILSALGVRATVAAIPSPQQRIARIEKKMAEMGEKPVPDDFSGNDENAPRVKISGQIRMADGSPVPKWIDLLARSSVNNSAYVTSMDARNGFFTNSIREGTLFLGAEADNFAPACLGPLDGLTTNRFEDLEIILQRGFDVTLQLADAQDGKPVGDAKVATTFLMTSAGFRPHFWKAGADGIVTLTHCADMPMNMTVNAPGYEITQKEFEHVRAGEPLRLALRRGANVSGVVLDKVTGRPVAGAELHLLYQSGAVGERNFQWDDALHALGKTDARGAFAVDQLRTGARYYIGISAPGHESVILPNIIARQSNLIVRVGPELVVRGRVVGRLDRLQQMNNGPVLWHAREERYENISYEDGDWAPLHTESGVTRFQFTNRVAGLVKISARSGGLFEREVDAPVDDWVIDLNQMPKTEAKDLPKREVVFRFKHPSGVPPRGTVSVTIPDSLDIKHLTAHTAEMEITNGEVRAEIAIGGQTSVEPKRMVGYWFNHWTVGKSGRMSIEVTNGAGPLVVEIPLLPAGAIYAKARNADGTPAGGLLFGVSELKRAPGRDDPNALDSGSDGFSDSSPRKWVSGPLPLGGTYQIHAWRGNSFCVSKSVKLTEANPDAEIELQFAPGKTFDGVVLDMNGKPLPDAELKVSFVLPDGHGFELKSVFTDERGRFRIEDTTPDRGGYSVEANAPGAMDERVKLDFGSQPLTIRLKPGRTLAGRVVEAGTGYVIPNEEVRAQDFDREKLPMVMTRTDAAGRFEFTTLGDGNYTFYFSDGQLLSDEKFRADGNTNVVLMVKLYAWSKVKPRAP